MQLPSNLVPTFQKGEFSSTENFSYENDLDLHKNELTNEIRFDPQREKGNSEVAYSVEVKLCSYVMTNLYGYWSRE